MDLVHVEELESQIQQIKFMIQKGLANQYNAYLRSEEFIYNDPLSLPDVFRAVLEEDIDELDRIKRRKRRYALNESDENGNTPLHVAVIRNKLKSVNYLLSQDDVSVNAKNAIGQTPLHHSVRCDKLAIAERLMEEEADINARDNQGNTPLHVSVCCPEIVQILLEKGADVNIANLDSDTALHNAVTVENIETVCMFLYYNCDTSVKNANGNTPFMDALIYENVEIQDALFEYNDDFNVCSSDGDTILTLALTYQSPYVEKILLRGAKVNRRALESSLMISNYTIFEIIWKRLPCIELENSNLLDKFAYGLRRNNIFKYINIILENSDNDLLESLATCFSCQLPFTDFIEKCAYKRGLEHLTQLTCVLLEYNCQFFLSTIFDMYVYFGYCDLFKYFLYMDGIIDNIGSNCPVGWIIPRYIYSITSDINSICQESGYDLTADKIHMHVAFRSLEFSINPSLIKLLRKYFHGDKKFEQFCDNLPNVPSLLEIAREETRKYIVNKFKFCTPSQYYTFINVIDINNTYKKILRWELPIYNLNVE